MKPSFLFDEDVGQSAGWVRAFDGEGRAPSPPSYPGAPLYRSGPDDKVIAAAMRTLGSEAFRPKDDPAPDGVGQAPEGHGEDGPAWGASPCPGKTSTFLARLRGRTTFRTRRNDDDDPPPCPAVARPPTPTPSPAAKARTQAPALA